MGPKKFFFILMTVFLVLFVGSIKDLPASTSAPPNQQQRELSLKLFKQQWEDLKTTPAFQAAPFVPNVLRCLDPTKSPRVNRTVFGYYAGQGYEGIDFGLISHLALAFVDADANGHISQLPLSSYPNWYGAINAAHDQGVKVVLVVRNQYFDSEVLSSIVRDRNRRTVLIGELLDTVQRHCLDGVSVDFENVNSADRDNVTLFMEELAQTLRSANNGYHISFATPAYDWGNDFDYPALSRICDALLMMQYVYYGSWSSTAGPQAPVERNYGLSLLDSIQGEYLDLGIPPQKLVLLMPYYGYQWKVSAGSDPSRPGAAVTGIYDTIPIHENPFPNMAYDETIDLRGQNFHYFIAGDTWVQGWCDDARSIGKKCDLVQEFSLQGVGMWRLEYGNGYSELWKEIEQRFALAARETISAPSTPSGPLVGLPGLSYTFSAGGSSSNLGHPLEYRFDWGDGNYSSWSSSPSAPKSWASAGIYEVKAQARCSHHPSVTSDWSPGLSVTISPPPPPPANVSASDGAYTDRVRVTWSASPGATGYRIFRNTSNDSSGAQQVGTSTALTYDDLAAIEGTTHWYWVKAYSNFGDSEFSGGDSGYVALSWHSESVNWTVYYGNNWNQSGTVTKPGAVRIRLRFKIINTEARYDHLRTDGGNDWSGFYSNVTSREKTGSSIGLTLTSDWSITGYFVIDRVEWQGASTGPATKGGTLFQAAEPLYFGSGWEDGQTLGFMDRVQYSKSVAGYFNTSNPPPECSRRYRETVRSGNYALMIAGYSQAAYAYCYYRVFDLNLPVVKGMKIGYWIYHSQGTPKISVDGHFTDGMTLRDFNNNGFLTDQYGVRIHPGYRRDPMGQWYYVEVDLSKAAGKTLAFIMFAFDNGSDGFTGQYRAYVDDFRIFTEGSPLICQVNVPTDHWKGEYFNNNTLSATPSMVRDDGAGLINFDWGLDSPGSSCGLGADNFSVRWTRTVNFSGGDYKFTVTADDGVRLWIDGHLKLDKWLDQAPTTYTVGPISLSAGNHSLKMEYYENGGGAVAKLSWASTSSPPPAGESKLTIHTSFLGGESMRFIEQVKPAIVKILENFGPAQEVKRKSPNTRIVGRIWYDDRQRLNDGNPEDRAQEWWNNLKDIILANPAVDYWEGYNEPGVNDVNVMNWYARFEKKRVEILAAHGLKACIGNFSTGVPDVNNPDLWPAFYPAIDAAMAHDGVLGLHEYSAPSMDSLFDRQAGEGWLTGRYRKVYRQFLIPAGKEIPLVITECGIDGGVLPGGGGGWKNYTDAQNYFHQLMWYDRLLQEDDYVLGATIFALEIYGWESFDISGEVLNRIIEYAR